MPQLDIVSFPNQIFSVIIVFFFLYFVVSKNIIPSVQKVQFVRNFSLYLSNKYSSFFSVESTKTSVNVLESYSESSNKTENQINVLKDSLEDNSKVLYSKLGSDFNSNKKYLSSFIGLKN
jgi:hypothetical protein